MIQLKSMELQGFKSFPDKTLINFSRGITAVVGPNGSGKSNISDAIRWAMGETSSKSLRGSKMEDVIFTGTKTRKPVGFAQVTLNFDNEDGELPISFSEVSVTRRYYRSGESEYYINKNQVRLKDIQDLLRDTGLGKDGYSIISQGAVTEIITAKAADRRSVFEEAAGIARYRYKKEESERKLRQTEDNIVRLSDIARELSERIPLLERQSAKARKYLELYERKKILDVGLWIYTEKTSSETLKKAEETLSVFSKDLENASKILQSSEEETKRLEEEIRLLTAEIEDSRNENAEKEKEIQESSGKVLVLQNEILHTEENRKKISELLKEAETKGEQTDDLISKEEERLKLCLEKIEKLKGEYLEIAESERSFSEEEKAALEKIVALRNAAMEYSETLTGKKTEAAELSAHIVSDKERSVAISVEKETLKKTLSDWENTLKEKETSLENVSKETEEIKNKLSGGKLKLGLQKEKAEKLNSALMTASSDLNDKKQRLLMQKDLEQNNEGFAGSVQKVLSDAKKGILTGICGTVASLIKVDKDHTVAVETALANAIQDIVTEDEKSAKNAIFHLKQTRSGRATFMPVETIKGKTLNESEIKKGDGYIGIASDLVSCDKKYREIIKNLLGKTLVAEDLDSAVKIAAANKYAYKTVTSDGQTVNAGGSLTGGSVAKNVGILSRKNEIEALEKTVAKLEENYKKTEKDLDFANEEYERALLVTKGLEDELSAKEKEKLRAEMEISHAKEFYEEISSQLSALEKEEEEAAKRISSSEEITKKISEESRLFEDKISKAEEDISLAEKQNEEIKAKQDEIREKLREKNIEIVNAENEEKTVKGNIERYSEEKLSSSDRKKELENEFSEEEKKANSFREEIVKEEQKAEEIRNSISSSGEKIQEKIKERTLKEKKISDLRDEDKETYALKEKLVREIEKTEAEKNSVSEKLENMQNVLWDEYEITPTEAKEKYKEPEDVKKAEEEALSLKNKIRVLGTVNVESIEEYVAVKSRFDSLDKQLSDLTDAKEKLIKIINGLMKDMEELFAEQFKTINIEFERVFKQLFNGGEAKLTLVDSENMLEAGIDIYAAPPGKVINNMSALSGGEQSLTAIALYFAILKIHPAPFCLLDEIEAALDDVNVTRFAEYLKNLSEKTQLITITHRRGTMETADRLYGVTMREKGVSRILTVNVNEIEENM